MSFPDPITLLNAASANQDFNIVKLESNSTVRKDATRDFGQPYGITISHQVTKAGIVQSVVWIERTEQGDDLVTLGNGRVQFKMTYDPSIIDEADMTEMVGQLIEFLGTSGYLAKLYNGEH